MQDAWSLRKMEKWLAKVNGGEELLFMARKAALPVSLLYLFWLLFLKRTGFQRKKDLIVKEPLQTLAAVELDDTDAHHPYHLKNLVSPRIYGWPVQIFSRLLTSVFGRYVMSPVTKKKWNLDLLRKCYIPEFPTLYPFIPCDVKAIHFNDGETNIDLWKYLKPSSDDSKFKFCTISDYVEAFRNGNVTPLDVAKRAIDAIKKSEDQDPRMGIVTQFHEEEILEMARASTQRYKNNEPLSIFDGIPITAKDNVKVAGYRCCAGTPFLGSEIETEESEAYVIKKLRSGGAVILGVVNMHQLGIGVTGLNPSSKHGTARNPYNPEYFTGGSSSGSGASVAAGICPLSIGVDGGGSIRIPSTCCGVVGIKASFGRISGKNLHPFGDTVSHVAFIAGPDVDYKLSLEQPSLSLDDFENTDLTGLKLGIDWTFFKHAEKEIVEACEKAVNFLQTNCNAKVVNISIPELEEVRVAHSITILTEMASYGEHMFNEHFEDLNVDIQSALAMGRTFSGQDYFLAQKQRTRSMNSLKNLFEEVDCILTPAVSAAVPKIEPRALKSGSLDTATLGALMRYMVLGNLTGIPCMVVPVSYDRNGLPIGVQIMTSWWNESVMLRVAHATEGFLRDRKEPQVHYKIL